MQPLQDAEAAELAGAIDDGGFQTQAGGHAGGVEAGAAAANADEIVCRRLHFRMDSKL